MTTKVLMMTMMFLFLLSCNSNGDTKSTPDAAVADAAVADATTVDAAVTVDATVTVADAPALVSDAQASTD